MPFPTFSCKQFFINKHVQKSNRRFSKLVNKVITRKRRAVSLSGGQILQANHIVSVDILVSMNVESRHDIGQLLLNHRPAKRRFLSRHSAKATFSSAGRHRLCM